MKVKQFILFGLLGVSSTILAQKSKLDVQSQSLSIQGDSLIVSLKMVAYTPDLGAKSYLLLTPVVKGEAQSKELLPVLVNGKKRHRQYERMVALEKRKGIKSTPIYSIIGNEGNSSNEISYRMSVALENWMPMAGLAIRKKCVGDSGELLVDELVMLEDNTSSWQVPVRKNPSAPVFVNTVVSAGKQSVTGKQRRLLLKGSYISPESDATDARNQKELNFSLDEARVMAEMNPQMLSLRELYMVAISYKDEPSKFYKVIETGVKVYPANPVANLNAAAAAIEQGNVQAAGTYLKMAPHETIAYRNCRGAYELMCGNLYEGIRLLKSAKADGSEEAEANLMYFFEENKR